MLAKSALAAFGYAVYFGGLTAFILCTCQPFSEREFCTNPVPAAGDSHTTTIDYRTLPNIIVSASVIGTLSTIPWTCMLFECFALRPPNRVVGFLADICLTVYFAEILIGHIWLHTLRLIIETCQWIDNRHSDDGALQPLRRWWRTDEAMYLMQTTMAGSFVWLFVVVSGVWARIADEWFEWFGRAPGDPMRARERKSRQSDVGLDDVCPEDVGINVRTVRI